ncbi:hypothetical protein Asp14428_10000 [Actinoplanes sp. NBRC 14428]|uniref:TetR family transcriptional regulator n=1 Tax=Pseudosporangium ferrugineum TaxID=439699 RepID=A0A2T0SFP3_9ACTN|nr:TetR family transcriptional regulator C-terminal domain-containing protein [Pseudosporangium ferrugineum]PRY32227.1 TetR family transcriptional regulator [Pseudosporangium ferrugineum]BCJ49525.1 hypothetical protein Asp14428_10000 [Actinoplanes sp. NBRC 14428]
MARLGDTPAPRDLLRTIITAVLPLDAESRDDGRVALAFLAYTAVRPEAGALRADTAELSGFFAGLLPVRDPEAAAAGLLALMEGLGVYLLGGQYTPERAPAALDAHLDLLFSSP